MDVQQASEIVMDDIRMGAI